MSYASRRRAARFVSVNCATLRGDNAMSALFGHTKGAFTGAEKPREGLLKAADGGTIFLDEIGELGLAEQAMLLSAIETVRMPLGSDTEGPVISSLSRVPTATYETVSKTDTWPGKTSWPGRY